MTTEPRPGEEALWIIARRVLSDVEYLTWAMAMRGISQRDIALLRHRSRGTVADTIARAERKIEEAQHARRSA